MNTTAFRQQQLNLYVSLSDYVCNRLTFKLECSPVGTLHCLKFFFALKRRLFAIRSYFSDKNVLDGK